MIQRPLAINAAVFGSPGMSGLQRYIGEVLVRMVSIDSSSIILAGGEQAGERWPQNTRRVPLRAFSRGSFYGNLTRLVWSQMMLPGTLRRMGARAFYSPVPEGMLRPPCPQVVTVHDIIPLRYSSYSPRQAHYYRRVLPSILGASSAVIAVSESTARDLRDWLGLDAPIHVVYQGYRADLFRPAPPGELPPGRVAELGEFVLSVAEARPYKNLTRLVQAFARVAVPGLRLALVGRIHDAAAQDLLGLAARLGLEKRVLLLGAVPDDELAALYRAARAFVFPSLWEGFGIPPLEAMASGCPVAASRVASIPEVCGDAALYFDPEDIDAMAETITSIVEDETLHATLSRRGVERATLFSYDRCAADICAVLRTYAGDQGDASGVTWAGGSLAHTGT